jgi:anaerobic selenocysteine-containing dehydrogenase
VVVAGKSRPHGASHAAFRQRWRLSDGLAGASLCHSFGVSSKLVRAACPHDCPDTCAMLVTVEDGRAVKVHGNPDHPPTHGVLCTKVSRYTERTYHAERVLHPLRRVGPKGSGRFERVSWDAALSDIAARLKSIAGADGENAEAILPYSYCGTMGMVQGESMAGRFFHKLGAARLDRTICSSAGGEALAATYGAKVGMHVEHYAESRLIVIWGSNSITSNLHFWSIAQQAKRDGARLVCIDPRRTETAERCHQHIALLPGTDGALALGLMHELVAFDWLDHDYVEQHTEGWPALRQRALEWPPERVAAVCGIAADVVRSLARDYATTKPAAIRLNYGMQRVHGGGNAVRLIAILPCLVGAWRHRAGGLLLSSSGWFRRARNDAALQRPDLLGARCPRIINMTTIGDDLLRQSGELLADGARFGPKIEALVVYNSNPLAIAPHSARVAQGFGREDLFTVVLEHFMTDTADLADYVLPATTQLEHLDVHTAYGHTYALVNEAAIAPLGEALPNTQIFRELAAHIGFTDPCFADSDEDLARQAFRPAADGGLDFEALREQGWVKLDVAEAPFADGGFPTPSGKCRIDAPGYGVPDHIANRESAASSPQLAARYPLAMISPPERHFLNSSFANVKSLRGGEGEPVLEIAGIDAASRGIATGQRVRIFNDRGSIACKAVVGDRARPGVVNGLGIWWKKLAADGRNVNELTHQGLTDIGRGPSFYDCLVEVEPLPYSPLLA